MKDYKKEAAEQAFQLIQPGQAIGLGDGATIHYLTQLIAADKQLTATLTLVSSSVKTVTLLQELDLPVQSLSDTVYVDIYFDGCDQFDRDLNALKSGSGIHTMEKIVASMANEFILVGDSGKFSAQFTSQFPIVIEIIPAALGTITSKLRDAFPHASIHLRQQENHLNDRGNHLLELRFDQWPDVDLLNTFIKMLPGVVDHSLFYHMATQAIISGPDGISIID